MESYSIADAKARFSEVVEHAEAGHTIDITKRGKLVARVVPVERQRKPFDFANLKRFTDSLPFQEESAGEFVRRMRDENRY
jgi:prevent-host-death family protein